jgi:hypothetical protein
MKSRPHAPTISAAAASVEAGRDGNEDGDGDGDEEGDGESLDPGFLGGATHLHNLAALLMCGPNLDLHRQLARMDVGGRGCCGGGGDTSRVAASQHGWLGSTAPARRHLLARLQTLLPAQVMLPEARLEVLVEQGLKSQMDRCLFHNARATPLSLFSDYACGPEQLPSCTVQVLDNHQDEVWHLRDRSSNLVPGPNTPYPKPYTIYPVPYTLIPPHYALHP